MKKNLKIFCSLIAFAFLAVSTTFAQDYPDATMSSDSGITLPSDSPIVEKYEIDFSTFNWTEENAVQGATYLDEKSDLVTVKADFENSRLVVTLDLQSPIVQNWTMVQWRTHLKNVR